MQTKNLFILYVLDVENFASKNWLYYHFEQINSRNIEVEIITGLPEIDSGNSLVEYLKKQQGIFEKIIIISFMTDKNGIFVDWNNVKKLSTSVIVFPLDAISVLSKFYWMIRNVANVVWCPHLQVLDTCKTLNKNTIYMPYGSRRIEKLKDFDERNNELFFQGTCHGIRKSFIYKLADDLKKNIHVQGKDWFEKNNLKVEKTYKKSILKSLNFFLKSPKNYKFTLIKNLIQNKFFFQLISNYPNRIFNEYKNFENENITLIDQNKKIFLGDYKYTLGINFLFSSKNNSYRLRDFEAASFGTCHFSNSDLNLEKFYLPNKHMLYYRDKKDLIEMINFYMYTEKGRILSKEIAFKAREESNNHTWEKRLEKLLSFIEIS